MGGSQSESRFDRSVGNCNEGFAILGAVRRRSVLQFPAQDGQKDAIETHSTPATPSTTRFSPVIVPVLSKQQISTRPAKGILKGSVQKMAVDAHEELSLSLFRETEVIAMNSQYLLRATREALTAIVSSIGSSGGTTEVIMMTQSSKSFERLRSCSTPVNVAQRSISSSKLRDRTVWRGKLTFNPNIS